MTRNGDNECYQNSPCLDEVAEYERYEKQREQATQIAGEEGEGPF
jgi:hypothetical protein